MSKSKAAVDRITLEYFLADLPTAQHKAGLAGLVLQIREIAERGEIPADEIPVLEAVTPPSARIALTEKSCSRLMDELYTAQIETVTVRSKWSGADPVKQEIQEEIDSETGRKKKTTLFTYEIPVPRNPFLSKHLDHELWQKLWRDMLWNIPRAKPTTRTPYNNRAAGQSSGEGRKVWDELVRFEKDRRNNLVRTTAVSSALLLGAQDVNAEQVPFEDRSDHALLLHFWPIAALIYVPWQLAVDPANPGRSQEGPVGYTLAIPEVCDLETFCDQFPAVLEGIAAATKPRAYRPAGACIDIAAQSALEFMESQAWLASEKIRERPRLRALFNSVEYLHLNKVGNNVKSLGSGRVAPDPDLLDRYDLIHGTFRNATFRMAMLQALFDKVGSSKYGHVTPPGRANSRATLFDKVGSSKYEHFGRLFDTWPHKLFLRSEAMPLAMKSFPGDALRALRSHEPEQLSAIPQETARMTDGKPPSKSLESLILGMVRNYVRQKAQDRSGIKYDTFKDKRVKDPETGQDRMAVPNAYREAQEHIAEKVFLEIRSRHGKDFANYFADCFGSTTQRSISRPSDFEVLSKALLLEPDNVRVLTLLALSACS